MNTARLLWSPAATLTKREFVRFIRQRSRVIGALATPLLFWFVIGSGLGRSFRPPGAAGEQTFLTYFFPGAVMLSVLFTAIFSCISIIEDRHEGFLQSVMVAPVRPLAIVLGKVGGCSLLAVAQSALFLLLAPAVGIHLTPAGLLKAVLDLSVSALGLASIGFTFAWLLDSVQGFHAVMNLLLMPMWLMSGALFPASGAHGWVKWVMAANPLQYGVAELQRALAADGGAASAGLPASWLCWLVLGMTTAIGLAVAGRVVERTSSGTAP